MTNDELALNIIAALERNGLASSGAMAHATVKETLDRCRSHTADWRATFNAALTGYISRTHPNLSPEDAVSLARDVADLASSV